MTLRIEILHGAAAHKHLDGLARLRIAVFRDWPYLYDGDLAYEAEYLRAFSNAEGAAIVTAWDGDVLAGAATAAPLAAQADYVTQPFRDKDIPLSDFFYFGESVLLSSYRGAGVGVAFFAAREAAAREARGVRTAAFCAVVRDDRDPRRPDGYQPLDGFWRRRGYAPWSGMTCRIAWRELGAAQETEQDMQFWRKALT